jgi:hypothetical protein
MIKQNLKVQHIFLFKSRMNMAMIFLWNSLGASAPTTHALSTMGTKDKITKIHYNSHAPV